jgi:hypothetical protein
VGDGGLYYVWRDECCLTADKAGSVPGCPKFPTNGRRRLKMQDGRFWFQNKSNIGLRILRPSGGTYQQFAAEDLPP